MGKPTNPNCPAYLDGNPTGAGYKPSITVKEALQEVKTSSVGEALKNSGVKFTKIFCEIIIDKKHKRGTFNSNPWTNTSLKGQKAQEYTVESTIWRIMSLAKQQGQGSYWFLGKHRGAYNEFDFWHISNPESLKKAVVESTAGVAIALPVRDTTMDDEEAFLARRASGASPSLAVFSLAEDVPDSWD